MNSALISKKALRPFLRNFTTLLGTLITTLLNYPECLVDFSGREHDLSSISRCRAEKTLLGFEPAVVSRVNAQLSRSPP